MVSPMSHVCLTSVSRRLGNGRRCRASWRVVRLQQDVAADSRAVVGSAACSTASLWQRRVIRVALCPSHGWRQAGSLRHLQNSSSSGMAINARHRGRVAAKDRVGSSARCPSGAWMRRACWRPWRRTTLQRQPIIWTMMSGTRRRTSGWSSGAAACSSTAFFSTDAPCSAVLRWWLLRGNAVRGKQGLQRSNMRGALPTRWQTRGDGKCCAPNPSTVVQTPRQRWRARQGSQGVQRLVWTALFFVITPHRLAGLLWFSTWLVVCCIQLHSV